MRVVLIGLCLLAGGCLGERAQQPSERAVVELLPLQPGEPKEAPALITEADYRHELARARFSRESGLGAQPLTGELKEALLERLIDRRLLSMQAAKLAVRASTASVDREVAAMRRSLPNKAFDKELIRTYQTEADIVRTIEERLTAAKLLKQEAFQAVHVGEEDLQRAWEALPAGEKVRPARVHAAQIVVRTEDEGRKTLEELRKKKGGPTFEEAARAHSVSPEAARGGDLGWFEAGVMPTVFDQVCFALQPGQISELIPSEYGFHIFKVLEIEAERSQSFEEARPKLAERLREERLREAEASYLAGLRAQIKVVRHDDVLAAIE